MGAPLNAFFGGYPQEHQRCDCHDCTQARWRMSFQGQLAIAPPSTVTTVTYKPEHVHRWVERIDEDKGVGFTECDECHIEKPA